MFRSVTFQVFSNPQPPGLVKERWLKTVHVVLVQGVLHVVVVEERELVVDLRDPRALVIVLALGDLVNLLLKLLQAWGVGITAYRNIEGSPNIQLQTYRI